MPKTVKLLYLLAFSFFVANCGGQNTNAKPDAAPAAKPLSPQEQAMAEMEKSWHAPWEIQVDESIFNHHHVGVYSSDKYDKAVITVVMMPATVSFAEQKKRFLERKSKEGEQFKGVVTIGGREVLLRKSLDTVENLTLAVRQYLLDAGNGQMLMLSATCKPEDAETLDKTFEAAVQSLHAK